MQQWIYRYSYSYIYQKAASWSINNLGVRCPGVATEEGCHGGPSSCDEDQHAGSAAMPAAERVVKPGFVP